MNINPFVLAWAPYAWSNSVGIEFYALVIGAHGPLVGGTGRLRRAAAQGRGDQRARSAPGEGVQLGFPARAWVAARRPGPTLDHDPVLWREWRRGRPSRMAKVIWGFYIALALAGTAWSIFFAIVSRGFDSDIVGLVSGLQATFGLLLVSMTAPTALAEERAQGSLDVLMTTPLSTDRIVLAKWWGAYRVVPALALLPAIGALIVGFAEPEITVPLARGARQPDPLGWIDRVAFVCLPTALLLAQGAVVASFGLALATWMRRVGRAIAVSVASYAIIAIGWLISLELEFSATVLANLGLVRATTRGLGILSR